MKQRKTHMRLPLGEGEERLVVKRKRKPSKSLREPTAVWVDGQECLKIQLTKGMFAIIDKEDAPLVSKENWHLLKSGKATNSFYACRCSSKKRPAVDSESQILMHRLIMWPDCDGKHVDHKNCNGLDNRRANLRIATPSQNQANQRTSTTNTSGFKGVVFHKESGLWAARLSIKPKPISLGYFKDPIDAAKAYNEGATKYFGEFARLNPIPTTLQQP